jgi:hypothetical protein
MTISPEDPCVGALKTRYPHLNPLVFHRSLEKARNPFDFFEILESIPEVPFSWDEGDRRWVKEQDMIAQKKLKNIRKK